MQAFVAAEAAPLGRVPVLAAAALAGDPHLAHLMYVCTYMCLYVWWWWWWMARARTTHTKTTAPYLMNVPTPVAEGAEARAEAAAGACRLEAVVPLGGVAQPK